MNQPKIILEDVNEEVFQKRKKTNSCETNYQKQDPIKASKYAVKIQNLLQKHQVKRQFAEKLKQANKDYGNKEVMNYLKKFHNIFVASYNGMEDGITYDFTCIAYLYEYLGITYAMDIQTGQVYRVASGTGFALNREEKYYVLDGNAIAYDNGCIDYDLYQKYNYSFDTMAKSGIRYDMTTLNGIIADIKQFIIVTNGFQMMDCEYVQKNLEYYSTQKRKKKEIS